MTLEELIHQIVQENQAGDRMGLAHQRLARAYALQQPMDNPYANTPGGALFGGLADIVRGARGAWDEGKQRALQDELIRQQGGNRESVLGANPNMGDLRTQLETAAKAAALRNQQQPNVPPLLARDADEDGY